ncbi:hypothetical protein LF1_57090 [Rubripirellula obstinata]|uniref:Uncharacterized protein n=1 Tax=Rubripirellula obstinata TaxID=406547 RepID=A0A5B1C9B7_9BACT|nr:hypothetical protein LF1_58390 [Rubripirellula obstinata]KAA1257011.1 hypothetical protein LF1_57090 [Rubripirellula obstinata]
MACTGVGLAAVFKWNINTPDPVMPDVIRLSRGRLLPASRPAGHNQRTNKTALPPTLDQYSSPDCPAGHQPTPEFQFSINADVPDALRGINQRLHSRTRHTASHRNLLCRRHSVTLFAR